MDAGRVLREARRRAGLTQVEVARAAGVSQATVARIESRLRVPKVDTLDRLLAVCGAQLILTRRLGLEVDREPIRNLLSVAPERRLAWRTQRTVRLLAWRRVRFILLGPVAERLHGSPVACEVVHLCVERTRDYRRRLTRIVRDINDRRFPIDGIRWRLTPPPPFRSLDDLRQGAVTFRLGKHLVTVASLDDLIRMRVAARSPEHLRWAEVLGAVREERDRLASPSPSRSRAR